MPLENVLPAHSWIFTLLHHHLQRWRQRTPIGCLIRDVIYNVGWMEAMTSSVRHCSLTRWEASRVMTTWIQELPLAGEGIASALTSHGMGSCCSPLPLVAWRCAREGWQVLQAVGGYISTCGPRVRIQSFSSRPVGVWRKHQLSLPVLRAPFAAELYFSRTYYKALCVRQHRWRQFLVFVRQIVTQSKTKTAINWLLYWPLPAATRVIHTK